MANIGIANERTRAVGLLTCAAVIYVSTDPGAAAAAWVHHAGAGCVDAGHVVTARHQLGNPPWASILVIFAHPGPGDEGYNASMIKMLAQGILTNNIIEIPNLLGGRFGICNRGHIGI